VTTVAGGFFGIFDRPALERLPGDCRDFDSVRGSEIGAFHGNCRALKGNAREDRLHLRSAHEFVGQFAEPHIARTQRGGYRKLHAEFGFEPRLRATVTQHEQLRLPVET